MLYSLVSFLSLTKNDTCLCVWFALLFATPHLLFLTYYSLVCSHLSKFDIFSPHLCPLYVSLTISASGISTDSFIVFIMIFLILFSVFLNFRQWTVSFVWCNFIPCYFRFCWETTNMVSLMQQYIVAHII
jgi:hypothetical protein